MSDSVSAPVAGSQPIPEPFPPLLPARYRTAAWYRALTLQERAASRAAQPDPGSRSGANTELAERLVARWRSQPPFTSGSHLEQRLATAGLSEEEFVERLAEPLEVLRDRHPTPPDWLAELARAFARPEAPAPAPGPPGTQPPGLAGFLLAIEPLLAEARERFGRGLEAVIRSTAELPFDPATVMELLFPDLCRRLLMMVSRTMVLQLNVERLEGVLEGESPEARFRDFVQRISRRDSALALLEEYPVLARQLVLAIDQWRDTSLGFVRRLCVDWQAIRTAFSPDGDPGVLVHVDGQAGDRHRSGRSVLIATFGSGLKLVYKPRSMSLDLRFQALLAWLDERGHRPLFRTLKVVDRGTYGWVEFVAAEDCRSADEVGRFYERQGSYLALLYALEATDFHHENLVAAGEHPVMVDLEALFHPRLSGGEVTRADQLAGIVLNHSVLRPGLLPYRVRRGDSPGIDVSGLGSRPGQLTPFGVPQWEAVGTDEMRFARKRIATLGRKNRPSLNGADVDLLEYAERILAGFAATYRLLLAHRDELLADGGPLAAFARDEVRVILRPTRTYGVLLYESFHPDVLRDALDRDRLFDRLWASVEQMPRLARVIRFEQDDLQRGDIPLFTTRPGSRDLWSSADEPIAEFFEDSGMTLVQRRVCQLSEDDLAQQLWIIRASLATAAMNGERARGTRYRPSEPAGRVDRERLLAAACAVGDRLDQLALRGDGDAAWIGLRLVTDGEWSLAPLGTDLYDGVAGVALFLAYLGVIAEDDRYTALARGAVTGLHRRLDVERPAIASIGGFAGWGGVVYAFSHLAALWREPALLETAEALVEALPPLIEGDEAFDVMGGTAGCIAGLISLYRCAPSDRTLAIAVRAGDHLLANARQMAHGVGWVSTVAAAGPLTGFSHGAAGIAWALLELAAVTGEPRFRTAALEAIAYERGLYSSEAGNWLDLREPPKTRPPGTAGPTPFSSFWCNGAPGIGLARLCALPHVQDAAIRAEIEVALATTLRQGFGLNHSLCHGDLGNLELFVQASQSLDDPRWRAHVAAIIARILASIERNGWVCGVPLGTETPGLMTGLAGIGYQLLRLAEPLHVPSVLVLAPPVQARPAERRAR